MNFHHGIGSWSFNVFFWQTTLAYRDIPILNCTGFSDILIEEKALALGIQGLMLKPIITKDFALKIRELLDWK